MEASPEITLLVLAWPIIVAVVILRLSRLRDRSAGIVTVYLITFTAIYWSAAAIQQIPSYTSLVDPSFTRLGFVVSACGLFAFLFGTLFARFLTQVGQSPTHLSISTVTVSRVQSPAFVPFIYYGLGGISYFVLLPILGNIPTLGAITTSMNNLFVVGAILLLCRRTTQKKIIPRWVILVSVIMWPLVTILNQGFLGFGLGILICTVACWLQLSRIKLKLYHTLLIIIISYFLLSFAQTYFIARGDIRGLVWGGSAVDVRTGGIFDAFVNNFGWFGYGDPSRLNFIEQRLDLSNLTGIAVARLNSGQVDYANGTTLVQAGLMVVPRILWPDKSVQVGSSAIISQYTGLTFATGTSVAAGAVMEFYINFGLPGVIMGFALIGLVIAGLDQGAARAFQAGNDFRFALYFLPAFGLFLIGDSAAAVGTISGSIAGVLLINFLIRLVLLPRNGTFQQTTLPEIDVLPIPRNLVAIKGKDQHIT